MRIWVSLTVLMIMDMVMELEDKYDISIPMQVVVEIYTVDELADTIFDMARKR